MKNRQALATNILLQELAVVVHNTLAAGHGWGIFRPIPAHLRGVLVLGHIQGFFYNFQLGNWSDETIHASALMYLFFRNGNKGWIDVVANAVFCGHDALAAVNHWNDRKRLILKAG